MRRVLLPGLLACIGLLLAAPAAHAEGRDVAAGGGVRGRVCLPPPFFGCAPAGRFAFGATSDPLGFDAHGHARFESLGAVESITQGRVTCLNVVGRFASVGGVIERGVGAQEPFEGTGFLFWVVDGDVPGPDDGPDLFSLVFTNVIAAEPRPLIGPLPPEFPNVCPSPIFALYAPVEPGNVVVRDALLATP